MNVYTREVHKFSQNIFVIAAMLIEKSSTIELYRTAYITTLYSTDFATFISSQTLNDGKTLISFDVVSIFTKVSMDFAIHVAQQCLLDDNFLAGHTSLKRMKSPNCSNFA